MKFIYPILSLLFFSLLYLVYKKSELMKCDRYVVNFGIFLFGAVSSIFLVLLKWSAPALYLSIFGFIGGMSAALAALLFLTSLNLNKLNISTTILNFSFIIPVVFSVIVWKEAPTINGFISVILVIISIFLIKNG